jgi:hypothetical protein
MAPPLITKFHLFQAIWTLAYTPCAALQAAFLSPPRPKPRKIGYPGRIRVYDLAQQELGSYCNGFSAYVVSSSLPNVLQPKIAHSFILSDLCWRY